MEVKTSRPSRPGDPDYEAFTKVVADAIDAHGADVLLRAWLHFTEPFLQVAELMTRVEALTEQAKAHGIEPVQLEDAIALLGYLRKCEDAHHGWLAAELIHKHCQNGVNLSAALNARYQTPKENDGQSASQDHRLPGTEPGRNRPGEPDQGKR